MKTKLKTRALVVETHTGDVMGGSLWAGRILRQALSFYGRGIMDENDKTAKKKCEKLGEERGVKFNITLLEGAFYNLKEIGNALRFIHDVSVTEISTEHPGPFGGMASSLVDTSLGHFDHVLSYLEAIFDGLDYNHY